MIDVLGVLMGIDMQGFSREEGSDELPPGVSKANMASPPSSPPPKPTASTSTPTPVPAVEPEDVEMAEEDQEEAAAKKEAEEAKKAGSDAYKKRNFEEAAKNFEKAWDIWPKDVTFLTNLGGMCSLSSYSMFTGVIFIRLLPH
jgi:stress-induced-phosphoprotein 1